MSEKKIATIYDINRICNEHKGCNGCPAFATDGRCLIDNITSVDIDALNSDIVKWCEEHPAKTRQSEFLKMFPNAKIDSGTGNIDICPQTLDTTIQCNSLNCTGCSNNYWLQEVE